MVQQVTLVQRVTQELKVHLVTQETQELMAQLATVAQVVMPGVLEILETQANKVVQAAAEAAAANLLAQVDRLETLVAQVEMDTNLEPEPVELVEQADQVDFLRKLVNQATLDHLAQTVTLVLQVTSAI